MKLFKKRSESEGVIFKLHVDFGYRSSSPIPYQKTGQRNHSVAVLAIPGSYGELFPGERPESIEFLSYIEDEKGEPCGVRCILREYSKSFEQALEATGIAAKYGIEQRPETELELREGHPLIQEANDFDQGVTTYSYRKFRLERIGSGPERQEKRYRLVGQLYFEAPEALKDRES